MTLEKIEQDLSCVEAYLLDYYNVVVDFDILGLDEYWVEDRTVTINSSKNEKHQLFVLLHETGHVILRDRKDFNEAFPDVEYERIETLKEEVMAWEEARKLAKKLDIELGAGWILNYRNSLKRYAAWSIKLENE
jgi:Zn-dependent peptidase ImmA (M78 family)